MNAPQPANPVRAVLAQLAERYVVFRETRPLAIGINKELARRHPEIDARALKQALHRHVNATAYLKATERGGARYDLDGTPAGEITEEQRQHAAETLKERFRKQAEERRAAEEARRAEAAAREAEQRRAQKLEQLVGRFGRAGSARNG